MGAHKLDGTVIKQKANRALRENHTARELIRRVLYEDSPRVQAVMLGQLAHVLGEQGVTLLTLNAELKEARE